MPSKIEYCDETLEVTGGCMKCSPGCTNCWAIKEVWRMAHNPKLGDKWQGLVEKKNGVMNWTGKIKCFDHALVKPLLRKKPTTYFVDSKADLFHSQVRFKFITRLHDRIDVCQQHTFLIFTKRIERAKEYYCDYLGGRIPENVQLHLSISTQAEADEKIPILLRIPAAVRGLSIEPMLEGIDLHISDSRKDIIWRRTHGGSYEQQFLPGAIVGGESGPGARPMHPDWVRNIRDQCVAAGVPFFFKQWGEWLPGSHAQNFSDEQLSHYKTTLLEHNGNGVAMFRVTKKKAGRLLDGKEWNQLPAPAASGVNEESQEKN